MDHLSKWLLSRAAQYILPLAMPIKWSPHKHTHTHSRFEFTASCRLETLNVLVYLIVYCFKCFKTNAKSSLFVLEKCIRIDRMRRERKTNQKQRRIMLLLLINKQHTFYLACCCIFFLCDIYIHRLHLISFIQSIVLSCVRFLFPLISQRYRETKQWSK